MRNRAWWQVIATVAVCLLVASVGTGGQAGLAGAPAGAQFRSEDGTGGPLGPEAVAPFVFSSSSGSYTEIAGGTVHGTNANDDESFNAVNLGFTFRYDGVDYTQVSIQNNGFVAMGATVVSSYTPISGGTSNNVVAALGLDLEGNGTTSELMSLMAGSAPNRVFTVQWKHYKRYSSGTTYDADDFNFQITLYETTKQVEIVYGTFAVTVAAPTTVQVGLRGASNADFNNRMTDATHVWANSLAGTANTSTMALTDTITPASGLTYAWAPFVGVTLTPDTQLGSACPGNDVIYNFTVTNSTGTAQAFNLAYINVWPATGPAATGVIAVDGTENVAVTVHVPSAASTGSSDLLTVTATAATTGTYTDTATATTTAALATGWLDLANITAGRGVRYHSVVYSGGKLYKIGGYNGTAAQAWLDIYDVAGNTWSAGADMPAALYYIDCEAISGKIYCAGGFTGSAGTNTLYIYDIAGNTWSTGATLPANRYNYASAQVGGKYYVIGGYTTGYEPSILVYDPVANTWDATRASMSIARRGAQAGVIGGKIYVAGGRDTASTFPSSGEAYDPVANTWSPIAPMPTGWINAADGVVHDRYLILTGGYGADLTASNYGLMYDAVNNAWSFLPTVNHQIYGSEGDSDGTYYWMASGRIYEGGAFSYSLYTTIMTECPVVPVELQTLTIE